MVVIEEPKLPVLSIVATHADRFSNIVTDDRRMLHFCTETCAVHLGKDPRSLERVTPDRVQHSLGVSVQHVPTYLALTEGGKHGIMVSSNVGKKASAVTADIKRFKNLLELADMDTVTPKREFEDGKVVGLTLFPSVVLHQQANTLGMRHIVPKGVESFELSWTYWAYADEETAALP